jgi:hypothetical protein
MHNLCQFQRQADGLYFVFTVPCVQVNLRLSAEVVGDSMMVASSSTFELNVTTTFPLMVTFTLLTAFPSISVGWECTIRFVILYHATFGAAPKYQSF